MDDTPAKIEELRTLVQQMQAAEAHRAQVRLSLTDEDRIWLRRRQQALVLAEIQAGYEAPVTVRWSTEAVGATGERSIEVVEPVSGEQWTRRYIVDPGSALHRHLDCSHPLILQLGWFWFAMQNVVERWPYQWNERPAIWTKPLTPEHNFAFTYIKFSALSLAGGRRDPLHACPTCYNRFFIAGHAAYLHAPLFPLPCLCRTCDYHRLRPDLAHDLTTVG